MAKVEVKTVKLSEIKLNPDNPRRIGNKEMERLVKSLQEFPDMLSIREIVVDETMTVLGGNMRLLALKKSGAKECTAKIVTGLTPEQKREFIIKDNSAFGSWNFDELANSWGDLPLADWGVDLPEDWLKSDAEPADAEPQIDKAAELNKIWKVKSGDLWQIGEHRLLCGDSTKKEDVGRVMGGEKADLCFTSPPYALGKSIKLSGNKTMSKKGRTYNQHEDDPKEWATLMDNFDAAVCGAVEMMAVNVQPLAGNKRALIEFISARADRLIDIATWNKGHSAPAMAEGVMSSTFEWVVMFGGAGASRSIPLASWRGTVSNVVDIPPQRHNENADSHAATMPVELPLWIIGTVCDKAKSILDPFLGSGTTMVACQNLNRKCRGIEISCDYVAVCLERMKTAFPGIEIKRL